MTERLELTWHWHVSCFVNGLCFGSFREPMCSRAVRRCWHRFIACMEIAFRSPIHCEEVHLRWVEMQKRKVIRLPDDYDNGIVKR